MTATIKTSACPFMVQTDDSLDTHITMHSASIDPTIDWAKLRRTALASGRVIHEADGSRVWRTTDILIDTSETAFGSTRFTWHSDGNRVHAERVEHTLMPGDLRAHRKVLRSVWVKA